MTITDLIRRMKEAGAPMEAILIAVEAVEERDRAEADRKAKRAEQKRVERERRATVDDMSRDCRATVADTPSLDKERSPTPPKEIKPSHVSSLRSETNTRAKNDLEIEFSETFWPEWPHKVGKPAALTSFVRARKANSLDAIMAGLRAYIAGKPVDRPWLNPTTFLNQERFHDRPAVTTPRLAFAQPQPPPSEPYRNPPPMTREQALEIHRRAAELQKAQSS